MMASVPMEEIERWLRDQTHIEEAKDLIVLALARAIAKEHEFFIQGPDDLVDDEDLGLLFLHSLASDRKKEEVRHVVDWIVAAVQDEAHWLRRTDARGRPLKLVKIGSLDRAVREADKAMILANQRRGRMAATGEGETVYRTLAEGWTLVRLETPRSLDLESSRMGHCIGNGAYDSHLESTDRLYLSLRDPIGEPHATMELIHQHVLQVQGKQNRPPIRRHADRLFEYPRDETDISPDAAYRLGFVVDEDARLHRRSDLPDSLSVPRSLRLDVSSGDRVSQVRLVCRENLEVVNAGMTPVDLPASIEVRGDLRLQGAFRFPSQAKVRAKRVILTDGVIEGLPEDLGNLSHLAIMNASIDHLPRELRTDSLTLRGISFDRLPEHCAPSTIEYVDGGTRSLPRLFATKEIRLERSCLERLPDGLDVCSNLHVELDDDTRFPAIGKNVTLTDLTIVNAKEQVELPECLSINSRLTLANCYDQVIPDHLGLMNLVVAEGSNVTLPAIVQGNVEVTKTFPLVLQAGMQVAGNLSLADLDELVMPEGLSVGGLTNVQSISGTVTVGKRSQFSLGASFDHIGRIRIEEGIIFQELLSIEKTTLIDGLEHLSDGTMLRIDGGGHVVLPPCRYGSLALAFLHSLHLPAGLDADGAVTLEDVHRSNLEDFREIGKGKRSSECPTTTIPAGARIGGDLRVSSRRGKIAIGSNVTIAGSLSVRTATGIDFGTDLHVGGDFDIDFLCGIHSLPDRLHVGGRLDGHRTVKSIGVDSTFGTLDLGAGMVDSLPKGLTILGDLNIGATDIEVLPDDIQVGGKVCLPAAFIGKTLPPGIDPNRVEQEGLLSHERELDEYDETPIRYPPRLVRG